MRVRGWLRRKLSSVRTGSVKSSNASFALHNELDANMNELRRIFTMAPDLVIRIFDSKFAEGRVALVYLEGLVDKNAINNNLLRPLLTPNDQEIIHISDLLAIGDVSVAHDFTTIESEILQGSSLILMEGKNEALVVGTHGWPQRNIQDPQLEATLKGAHQGFVETDIQNIALIRRYIPNRELKIKEYSLGKRGVCRVSVLFLADVVKTEVLQELEDRISMIEIDSIWTIHSPHFRNLR